MTLSCPRSAGSGAVPGQALRPGHCHCISDVDEVVGDHSEANPTLHTVGSTITASAQAVAALDHTDASFTTGPPRLRFLKPPALFQLFPLCAACAAIWHGDPLHTFVLSCTFLCLRVEARIGRHQPGYSPKYLLVRLHCRQ